MVASMTRTDNQARAEPVVSLKVLTLNTHKGFTTFNRNFVLHELRQAIRDVSADLVFLQEVLGSHTGHASRHSNWPATPQYEFLADSIWHDYAYGKNAVYTEGHHGNAILSKHPILSYTNHDMSIAGPERRGMLHCVIRNPGDRPNLHAICVHMSLTERHRRRQLGLLCDLIKREVPPEAPLIIAGDFNDWRLRANTVMNRCADIKEVFHELHGDSARTFPARLPLLRLDRIYYRNIQVLKSATLSRKPWAHLSDHAALYAETLL
jgi:endonuclease/exonuclease/phosphatase family metal-dependent hydrolase